MLGLDEEGAHCDFEGFQHGMPPPDSTDGFDWRNMVRTTDGVAGDKTVNAASAFITPPSRKIAIGGSRFNERNLNMMHSEIINQAAKPPPIKFHSAGGRSLSVSSDALKYARSLLGDPELGTLFSEGDADEMDLSLFKGRSDDSLSNKENVFYTSLPKKRTAQSTIGVKNFISPLRASARNGAMADNLIKKFDAVDCDSDLKNRAPSLQNNPSSNMSCLSNTVQGDYLEDGNSTKIELLSRSSERPLTDISNTAGANYSNLKLNTSEKRKQWRNSVSPFKRPRSTKFSTPLKKNVAFHDGNLTNTS